MLNILKKTLNRIWKSTDSFVLVTINGTDVVWSGMLTWFLIIIIGETFYSGPTFLDSLINFLNGTIFLIIIFSSVLMHEFAHIMVSRHYKILCPRISVLPFGMGAYISGMINNPRYEFFVAVAGPITSFALFAICGVLYLICPTNNLFFMGMAINFAVAAFNLLPVYPMDGGRIFRAVIYRLTHNFRVARITVLVVACIIVPLASFGWVRSGYGIMLPIILGFMLIVQFRENFQKRVLSAEQTFMNVIDKEAMHLNNKQKMRIFVEQIDLCRQIMATKEKIR